MFSLWGPIETARQEAYEAEVRSILDRTSYAWASFAAARHFAFEAAMFGELPGFRGALEGTSIGVEIAGVGSMKLGFRTRALVQALAPSKVDVHVAPHGAGLWDDLVELLRPSAFFGEPALDHRLVVTTSSHDLALRVLDERVRRTVRVLAPVGLRFTYASGGDLPRVVGRRAKPRRARRRPRPPRPPREAGPRGRSVPLRGPRRTRG